MQYAQSIRLKVIIKYEAIECDPNVCVDPLNDLDAITHHNESDADIAINQEKLEQSDNELELEENQMNELDFESENDHTNFEENFEFDEDINVSNIKQDEDEDKIMETESTGKKFDASEIEYKIFQ